MKMGATVDEILAMAGTTLADLAAAQESPSVHTLYMKVNDAGELVGAVLLGRQTDGTGPHRAETASGHCRFVAVWTGGGTGRKSSCVDDNKDGDSCLECEERADCGEWDQRLFEISNQIQAELDKVLGGDDGVNVEKAS